MATRRMEIAMAYLAEALGETNVWQEHVPPPPEPQPATEPSTPSQSSGSSGSSSSGSSPTAMPASLEPVSWPETGLAKGECSHRGVRFIPWRLVKNYPHVFIGKTNAARAAPFFNNENIHKYHPWDVYYLYNPSDMKNRYILFVPTYQFQRLLDIINAKLDTVLTIPGHKNAEKFKITFGIGGSPVPRFLGRSTSFAMFEALKKSLPPYNLEDDIRDLSAMAQQDFLDMLKQIQASSKGNKSKKSEKNRIRRIQEHKSWGKSVKRVQRYLGLRERASLAGSSCSNPSDLIDLTDRSKPSLMDMDLPALEKLSLSATEATDPAGVGVPFTGKPERSVVFVSIDIEAFEFSHDIITEVGMAVFDTMDIGKQSPGATGENWFPLIKGYHFRIKENTWAQNSVHVDGNADKFDFGTTEFVELKNIKNVIASIVETPTAQSSKENKGKLVMRHVVLVFHDSSADLQFLEKLRYDVAKVENVLEIVDTREMYQHAVKAMNPASLERVLADHQVQSRYLHNAGNDAVYTMQAMIALAIRQRKKSLERAAKKKESGYTEATVLDKAEGWLTGGEDSDGGEPGEKAQAPAFAPMNPLKGKGFQVGNDDFKRPPSPPSNVFSWSDNSENEDAEHLRW